MTENWQGRRTLTRVKTQQHSFRMLWMLIAALVSL
jgi:hypothetical protein